MSEEFDHVPGFDDGPLPSADGSFPPKPSRQVIDARAAAWQSRKTGKPLWAPMPAAVLLSDAWRGLTPAAVKVVLRVFAELASKPPDRRRNGSIVVTYDDFATYGIRRQSITEAVKRAEVLGLIVAKRGQGGKVGNAVKASAYGLTFLPWHGATDAADDWASEKCAALGRQMAAEQTEKHRKNKTGEANLNVYRLEQARRKLGRGGSR
jgi:hypothetical protein